jgi:hypothetical protein
VTRVNLLIYILLLAPLADVNMIPTDKFLRLHQDTGFIRLIYRNTSGLTWKNLQLKIRSGVPVDFKTTPRRIHRCQPADRCVFEIAARRTPRTPIKRFSAEVKLVADDHPELHTSLLFIDTTAGAGDRESGWIEAGTIKVGRTSKTSRVLVLALLSALPVIALIILGFYLKKKARKETG